MEIQEKVISFLENRKMPVKRAAGLVIFRYIQKEGSTKAREWLLLQTSYGQHHWTPPKGHLDPGEDDITAAYRETKEEAGVGEDQIKVYMDFSYQLNYEAFGNPKVVTYWPALLKKFDDPVILSDEHIDYKWLNLEDAISLSGYEDMARCLRDFSEKLDKIDS